MSSGKESGHSTSTPRSDTGTRQVRAIHQGLSTVDSFAGLEKDPSGAIIMVVVGEKMRGVGLVKLFNERGPARRTAT